MKRGTYCVGVIGFGGIFQGLHLDGWRKLDDVEVIAAADVSAEALKKAKQCGIPHVFEDYRKLLEIDEIDIVDICAP